MLVDGGGLRIRQTIHGAGENPKTLANKAQKACEKASRNHVYFPEAV